MYDGEGELIFAKPYYFTSDFDESMFRIWEPTGPGADPDVLDIVSGAIAYNTLEAELTEMMVYTTQSIIRINDDD